MYHSHFKGNHFEIGFRWGALLAERGNFILNHVPFPLTEERRSFAAQCLPYYQTYFPAILEEIRGIAAGQHCTASSLQTVLFSMYAMPPACCCSCFAVSNSKTILLGRNSDFVPDLEKWNQNVIYRFSSGSYAFTGNTTAFLEMEDGVNEKGLAIGLTVVYPRIHIKKPGLNAGMLLRLMLETCSSTKEAVHLLQAVPIGSSQTFTLADGNGKLAVVECNADKIAVLPSSTSRAYACATNVFHSNAFLSSSYINTWQSEERYQTMDSALKTNAIHMDIAGAIELLSGKKGFLCQYDRATGTDTVWSVLYDLKNKCIYRAEGNPSRKKFRTDMRFYF